MMPSLSETGSISASRHRSTARLIGPSGVTARLSPRSGKAMPGSNIDACSLWVEKHRLDDLDGDGAAGPRHQEALTHTFAPRLTHRQQIGKEPCRARVGQSI